MSTATTPTTGPMSVYDLCQALHAAGLVLAAQSRTALSASPRANVTEPIASAIKRHKPDLLKLLVSVGSLTPFACRYCGAEFVLAPDQDCRTCAHLRRTDLRFTPNSPEERAFLVAWEARTSARKTVPTLPAPKTGTVGTVDPQLSLNRK